MNAKKRKRIFNIIIILVTIGMVASIFAGVTLGNRKKKTADTESAMVTAEVYKAQFGSAMKVNLTEKGKATYKDASKMMVYVDGKQMSAALPLNKKFTVFPARKPGDKATIKLMSKANKELASVNVNLLEGK